MAEFIWLSDEYSVPAEGLCLKAGRMKLGLGLCVCRTGHDGACRRRAEGSVRSGGIERRDYSHKDGRP